MIRCSVPNSLIRVDFKGSLTAIKYLSNFSFVLKLRYSEHLLELSIKSCHLLVYMFLNLVLYIFLKLT